MHEPVGVPCDWKHVSPSPHCVEPIVFWHVSPLFPAPLGRQSNAPVLSFTPQVVPAAQPNGFDVQGAAFEDEEHATSPTAVAPTAKSVAIRIRMPRTLAHDAR